MNDVGDLLFRYFEKILAVLFGLALLASLVMYGPWTYGTSYSEQLAEIAMTLETRPEVTVDQVPAVPDYSTYFQIAGTVAPQESIARDLVWPLNEMEVGIPILPPSDVETIPDRGFVEIDWQYNTNQPPTRGVLEFVGVEVTRAKIINGEPAEYVNLTSKGDRDYYIPKELFENNREHAPLVTMQRQADRRRPEAVTSGLTLSDLWNAVHDGRLSVAEVQVIVRRGVQTGEFTSEQFYNVQNFIRMLPFMGMEERREFYRTEGRMPTQQELLTRVMEVAGYRGGGKYGAVEARPTPEQAEEGPVERVVRWGDVSKFYDSDVSPDEKYAYRMRFWARQLAEGGAQLRQSDWADASEQVSPKADTEFFLTGGSPMVGPPWIKVRKWLPTQNRWVTQDYQVSVGEQIGRSEMLPRLDSAGKPVRDERGNQIMEVVDFSTQCILLDFLVAPRVAGAARSGPGGGFGVDNTSTARYPMLTQTQILYSNRRGELRRKWQAPPSID